MTITSCTDAALGHDLLAEGEDKKPGEPGLTAEPQAEAALSSRPRILLAEDDFLAATEAEDILREAGFEVLGPANSAAEAVSLALSQRPALVVMDIRLIGQRDGIDAAREIYDTTGIRAIFATAYTSDETKRRADSVAPLAWLPKPYQPESLVEAVKNGLKQLKS